MGEEIDLNGWRNNKGGVVANDDLLKYLDIIMALFEDDGWRVSIGYLPRRLKAAS